MRITLIFFSLFISILSSCLHASIDNPSTSSEPKFILDVPLTATPAIDRSNTTAWSLVAGDDALYSGLPTIAQYFYRKALSEESFTENDRQNIILNLVTSLIQQSNFQEARAYLEGMSIRNSAWYLRYGLIVFFEQEWNTLNRVLQKIDTTQLNPEDQPWFFLLKGMDSKHQGKWNEATQYFDQALEKSIFPSQKITLETWILKEKIINQDINEALLNKLESKLVRFPSRKPNYPVIRQYACVLEALGQKQKALQVLYDALNTLPKDDTSHRPLMLILLGLMADNEEGQKALKEVLTLKVDKSLHSTALQLLSKTNIQDQDPEFFEDFLASLLDNDSQHPLMDALYLTRVQWFLSKNRLDDAQADAKALIERFPGSDLKPVAIRLLAYIAWQRNPPQYRLCADYLSQAYDEKSTLYYRKLIELLRADCFFMSGDYTYAAGMYASILEDNVPLMRRGMIAFELVMAYINSNALDKAYLYLMDPTLWPSVDKVSHWRAQWNYTQALKKTKGIQVATEYVQKLLQDPQPIPQELLWRFQWLQAELLLSAQEPVQALNLATTLHEELSVLTASPETDLIISQTLLLQARALFQTQSIQDAFDALHTIQTQYPETEAAIISYLEKSRHYASHKHFSDALEYCMRLLEKYPNSLYAPIALYEAAIYSELRGQSTSLEYAISLLERLVSQYPKSELVFYARIKQADLCRALNRFDAAHFIYADMIQQYPKHPDRYFLELSLGKTLLAMGLQDPIYLPEAAILFESLAFLPSISPDLRLEAAYHHAFTVSKTNNKDNIKPIYWMIITRFLKDETVFTQLTSKGHYWLGRCLFDLATILENEGFTEEANALYILVLDYNLPGSNLAQSKLK